MSPWESAQLAARMAHYLRRHPKLSDWELGRLLGVPETTIYRIRHGH